MRTLIRTIYALSASSKLIREQEQLEEERVRKNSEKILPDDNCFTPISELQKQQIDTNKCWTCTKKTGLLGYKCKCGYSYCKKHRLPETHSCDFDFAKEGKQILAASNPTLLGTKLEKI